MLMRQPTMVSPIPHQISVSMPKRVAQHHLLDHYRCPVFVRLQRLHGLVEDALVETVQRPTEGIS